MKISNFKAITDCPDDDKAIKYLDLNNWDETKASSQYFDENINRKVIDANNRSPRNPSDSELSNNQGGFFSSIMNPFSMLRKISDTFMDYNADDQRSHDIYNPQSNNRSTHAENLKKQSYDTRSREPSQPSRYDFDRELMSLFPSSKEKSLEDVNALI